ncbi:hypothetical protein RIF29_19454 [Crotalaria pallida]|uniref:Uncharacterized protein n=1 Tax=Crotalaria pallida TaxID=3830 RepID=A0AAN9I457_CROPI
MRNSQKPFILFLVHHCWKTISEFEFIVIKLCIANTMVENEDDWHYHFRADEEFPPDEGMLDVEGMHQGGNGDGVDGDIATSSDCGDRGGGGGGAAAAAGGDSVSKL